MNFVLYQFLWGLGLLFFLVLGFVIVNVFTRGIFRCRCAPLFEVIAVVTAFVYLLAFHINF